MNKKELINSLLLDIAHDEPISKVMLLAQAISLELKNKRFADWVRNEQRGYGDGVEIPKYREAPCILRADIFIPFQGIMTNFTIPTDIIDRQDVKNFLSSAKLGQSLSELEEISQKSKDGELRLGVPGKIFPILDKLLTRGNVQSAYRAFSSSIPKSIINTVKSRLLDYISFMSEEINMEENFKDEEIQSKLDALFVKYIWND